MPEFKIKELELKTRKCIKEDYPFVFKIMKELIFPFVSKYFKPSKEMFDERFNEDYNERTILLGDDTEVGLYQLKIEDDVLVVNGLFIIAKYQKKGIGKVLMDYFETLGYNKIILQVWDNNPAFNFYKKLGYKVVKMEKHKYHMEKKIKLE